MIEIKRYTLDLKAADIEYGQFKDNLHDLCGSSSNARERFIKLNKLIAEETRGCHILVEPDLKGNDNE